jgi:hypothetical protein
MRILHVVVNNKIATYSARDGHIVCGNSDYSLKFTFDSDWNAHTTKTARFIWNGMYYDVEFTGDECAVPIITGANEVTVGVYAGDLTTTTPATIPCERSILCDTNTAQPEFVKPYVDAAILASEEAKTAANTATAAVAEVKDLINTYIIEIDTLIGG